MDYRRIIATIIGITIILTGILAYKCTVCADSLKTDYMKTDGYKVIAESETLILYYNYEKFSIAVEDKRNSFVWSSVIPDNYNMEKVSDLWKSNMNSLFNVGYFNSKVKTDKEVEVNCLNTNPKVEAKPINRGVSLKFSLTSININVTLDIRLQDNWQDISIPSGGIEEKGEYLLSSMKLLPFLGAANDNEPGYVFYPDQCGAISYFKTEHPQTVMAKSWHVFGINNIEDIFVSDGQHNTGVACMPVFGIKKGDNAILAVISEGEQDSFIVYRPSGDAVNLYRIYTDFVYRRLFSYIKNDAKLIKTYDTVMIQQNRSIRYIFLAEDEADYSGMANAYRSYLIDIKKLRRSRILGNKIPLGLDIFMGITEERILVDKFISATTFDQACSIVDEFLKQGVGEIQVNLVGWTDRGYGSYPAHIPPDRKLGGEKGLLRIVEYSKTKDFPLFLQVNFVNASKGSRGFSLGKDTVHRKNGTVLSTGSKDRFLLNPAISWSIFTKHFIPWMKNYRISGLTFEKFGELSYYDYNIKQPVQNNETIGYWNKFMEESSNTFGFAAAHGGNAYILENVDRLFDIPFKDSGQIFTDECIPFYQMTVHGLIPYSSSPGNLFYDETTQKLKWVEYGYIPYYQLTYRESNILKNTRYKQLFASCYRDWLDTAINIYKEFNSRLDNVWSEYIIEHKKIKDGLFRVKYQNSATVYVNYNEEAEEVDGYYVNALDYLVVDEEGNRK